MGLHYRRGFIQRGVGGGCTQYLGESNPEPHFGGNAASRTEHTGDSGRNHDYDIAASHSRDANPK
jgi:hypothetical protein